MNIHSQLSENPEDKHLPLAAQRAELDRRLKTLDQDRRNGVSWAELKAEMERRRP